MNAVPQMHESVIERIELERQHQEQIADLRDEALDNEADRLESLADLQERHNDRILGLAEKLNEDLEDLRTRRFQSAEDLALEYQRDLEDLQTKFARELFGDSVISFADITAEQQQRLQQDTDYQRGLFDLNRERDRDRFDFQDQFGGLRPGSPGYDFYSQQLQQGTLSESEVEHLFGRRGRGFYTNFLRGEDDADADLASGVSDVNTEAQALASAIDTALSPLLEPATQTAEMERMTAALTSDTAILESTTAALESSTAGMNASTAALQEQSAAALTTGSKTLLDAAIELNKFNLDTFVAAAVRSSDSLENISLTLTTLPTALKSTLEGVLAELPTALAQGVGANPFGQVGSLSTGTPAGFPNSGQPLVIQNVISLPNSVVQALNENNLILTQEGRIIQPSGS